VKIRGTSRNCAVAFALFAVCGGAWAQTSVTYGRITAVSLVTQDNARAQRTGALVGGGIGLATGGGQSGSNRALRTIGGGFAGQQIARMSSNRQAFEYTVLVGGSTITMITDEAGMRVGDCVAVERGGFNNLRLVDEARCAAPRAASASQKAPAAPRDAVRQADACIAAKEQLLTAETDDAFDRAERRVRLLCGD
jgi:outer membrane lipoprotein SlyB